MVRPRGFVGADRRQAPRHAKPFSFEGGATNGQQISFYKSGSYDDILMCPHGLLGGGSGLLSFLSVPPPVIGLLWPIYRPVTVLFW
jgi:hypothetical protein